MVNSIVNSILLVSDNTATIRDQDDITRDQMISINLEKTSEFQKTTVITWKQIDSSLIISVS